MVATRIDHVSVTVSDMDRSLAFYCGLLGLERSGSHRLTREPIVTMTNKPVVDMLVERLTAPGDPEFFVDLQQYVLPPGGVSNARLGDVGHSHISFLVDDMDAVVASLTEAGVEFVSSPVHFDLEDTGALSAVFFYDPDGYALELMHYKR
jgi:catechol 2,3-dioxygenase-like lactoylglutathione lyase family enzyme